MMHVLHRFSGQVTYIHTLQTIEKFIVRTQQGVFARDILQNMMFPQTSKPTHIAVIEDNVLFFVNKMHVF